MIAPPIFAQITSFEFCTPLLSRFFHINSSPLALNSMVVVYLYWWSPKCAGLDRNFANPAEGLGHTCANQIYAANAGTPPGCIYRQSIYAANADTPPVWMRRQSI